MTKENEVGERKPYEAPQLHRVELTPEEMFVGGCKTAVDSSPAGATCQSNSCFTFGS